MTGSPTNAQGSHRNHFAREGDPILAAAGHAEALAFLQSEQGLDRVS
jgi:hypothetical protein